MEDLIYIAKAVTKIWGDWLPKKAWGIRLDYDGEICVKGCGGEYDFYPPDEKEAQKIFERVYGPDRILGTEYPIEELKKAQEQL